MRADETELVARIKVICDEFEAYGYRRLGAALRQQGILINARKVRRLMREHELQPKRRRRFVATSAPWAAAAIRTTTPRWKAS